MNKNNPEHKNLGILYIHAVKEALAPHLTWVLESALNQSISLNWKEQGKLAGHLAAKIIWDATPGAGAALASALRELPGIYFEINEKGTAHQLPGWFMHTPSLGIFYTPTDMAGNFLISEDRVRAAYEKSMGDPELLLQQFSLALGEPWNEELEPLRQALSEVDNVTVLRQRA